MGFISSVWCEFCVELCLVLCWPFGIILIPCIWGCRVEGFMLFLCYGSRLKL